MVIPEENEVMNAGQDRDRNGGNGEHGLGGAYLSQKNAGRYLDLSYGTVHRGIIKGVLPYFELPPGGDGNHKPIIRISRKELDDFIAGTRVIAS